MIGQRPAWQSVYFQDLVRHFELFSQTERERLARLYLSERDTPEALAMQLCLYPERLEELFERHRVSTQALELLAGLAVEHDLPVHVHGAQGDNMDALRELRDLGLLVWEPHSAKVVGRSNLRRIGLAKPLQVTFPGAFVLALPELFEPSRPSLFLLSTLLSGEEVRDLGARHDIAAGSRVVVLIELAEKFKSEGFIEQLIDRFEEPDTIGLAITALELGGMCYWQDIFGFDGNENTEDSTSEDEARAVGGERDATQEQEEGGKVAKILPLVKDDMVRLQQSASKMLQDYGIIYKFDVEEYQYAMLAVPEELWMNLWTLARNWILGWIDHTFQDLDETAISQSQLEPEFDKRTPQRAEEWVRLVIAVLAAQPRKKTMSLEAIANALRELDMDIPFAAVETLVLLGATLEIFTVVDGGEHVSLADDASTVLEQRSVELVQNMLRSWSMGRSTFALERHIGLAAGLDESWRPVAIEIVTAVLEEQMQGGQDLPLWMAHPGVEHELTGMGYLRDIEHVVEEMVCAEFSIANSVINTTRLLWFDLLHLLDEERWYSITALADLLQFVLAVSLFQHLAHLFDHPELSQYVPLQRPDYLTLPMHVDGLHAWTQTILEELLEPLGLAMVQGERVRLRTRHLKIEGPEDFDHKLREQFIENVFSQREDAPNLSVQRISPKAHTGSTRASSPFRVLRSPEAPSLSVVSSNAEEGEARPGGGEQTQSFALMTTSIEELVKALAGGRIVRYDEQEKRIHVGAKR